jgi:hypothetical protein
MMIVYGPRLCPPRGCGLGQRLLTLMVALALVLPAWSASAAQPATQYVEGDVLITFKPAADLAAAQRALRGHSLQFNKHFALLSQKHGRQVGLAHANNRSTVQLIAELAADPEVESAEPNYLRWTSSSVPNDASFGQLWGLQNTSQAINGTAGTTGDDIRFVTAGRTKATPRDQPPQVGG